MWAMTNRHKIIAKSLLDYGASPDIRSSSGGTAFDFVQPGTDISNYLHENGYSFGSSGIENDFYDAGFAHSRFEEEIAENEMKRRMMMEESAINLEVDLSSLGLDEKIDVRLLLAHTVTSALFANRDRYSLLMRTLKTSKSLSGIAVSTIKCLSFRKTSWIGYWTL